MFLNPGIITDLPARQWSCSIHLLGMEIPLLNYHQGLFHTLLDQNQQAARLQIFTLALESKPGTLSSPLFCDVLSFQQLQVARRHILW
jgi:hypothetical protein